MRVWNDQQWGLYPRTVTTPTGHWHGIAFGPNSREGLVRVNGVLLAAGQVLALSTQGAGYTIEALTGMGLGGFAYPNFLNMELNQLDPATTEGYPTELQLILFDSAAEAAAYGNRARAPQKYRGPWRTIANTGAILFSDNPIALWTFIGRRACQLFVQIQQDAPANELVNLEVWGYRYAVPPTLNVLQDTPTLVQTKRLIATTPALVTVGELESIVIGGTNEAEVYDALGVKARRAAGTAVTRLHVEAINYGELL